MGLYINSRGHVGANLGCFGVLIMLPVLAIYGVLLGVVLVPAAICLLGVLVGFVVDGVARIVPAYRRHRRAAPLSWPKEVATAGTDMVNAIMTKGKANPQAPRVRAQAQAKKAAAAVRIKRSAAATTAKPATRPVPPPPIAPPILTMEQLGAFQAHVRELFTHQGWTGLTFDGNQMVKGRGPDGAFTVIVCDIAAKGHTATRRVVETCAKMPATPGIGRAMLVTHGTFDEASIDLAFRSNLQLVDGAALAKLEARHLKSAAS